MDRQFDFTDMRRLYLSRRAAALPDSSPRADRYQRADSDEGDAKPHGDVTLPGGRPQHRVIAAHANRGGLAVVDGRAPEVDRGGVITRAVVPGHVAGLIDTFGVRRTAVDGMRQARLHRASRGRPTLAHREGDADEEKHQPHDGGDDAGHATEQPGQVGRGRRAQRRADTGKLLGHATHVTAQPARPEASNRLDGHYHSGHRGDVSGRPDLGSTEGGRSGHQI